jgi:hypothetical protein
MGSRQTFRGTQTASTASRGSKTVGSSAATPNTNGATKTNGPALRLAGTGGNVVSRCARPRRIPHSSASSRRAVCSRSGSSGSRRPPGNDQCPDQESSSRSERRMSKMDSRGRRARTIATAAWGSGTAIRLLSGTDHYYHPRRRQLDGRRSLEDGSPWEGAPVLREVVRESRDGVCDQHGVTVWMA